MKTSCTAERLKHVMKNRNLRQVDILELCKPYCQQYDVKMNKSDISQYLAGKSEPNQDKLVILSMALNVNESWLMGYNVPSGKDKLAQNETTIREMFERQYGKSTMEAISMYTQLDIEDQAEIRGEMKQMLKNEKYSIQNNNENSDDYITAVVAARGNSRQKIRISKSQLEKDLNKPMDFND